MIRKATAGDSSVLRWFKSSHSDGPDGNSCVEVATTSATVHVRDSKTIGGPQLAVTSASWADFVTFASEC
ncbi:DUF397 domain-containing protein [Streptomyces sp. GC420]|uniref:DUF397 domain-containing protein n=1 Tax=Streptomyces sp. GC420 TaxID=2697568 RepID=UPI001414D5D9|nr:DUF397 domain-containing protein [Streptomyces sp. GC420]NBM17246.1 DUF397 domain-containing protein [Streptomyces sp. GC420]